VGSRLPRPYHFRARIQSFQAVAAPFPGDSVCPQPLAPRLPKRLRSKESTIGSAVSSRVPDPRPPDRKSRLPNSYPRVQKGRAIPTRIKSPEEFGKHHNADFIFQKEKSTPWTALPRASGARGGVQKHRSSLRATAKQPRLSSGSTAQVWVASPARNHR
jgi:hypothetical protein